jgi:uncharacterized protein YuzE
MTTPEERSWHWTYDATTKAGYLYLSDAPVAKTTELRPNVFIDRDKDGNLVGVEILDV